MASSEEVNKKLKVSVIYIYIYITLLEIYFIFSRLNISLSPPYYFFQLILYFPHPEHDIIYI